MVHIGVGVIAFMTLMALSVLWVIGLSVCWAIVAPECVDWEITNGGKKLRLAKYLFTAAGALIMISLLLDVFVPNPSVDFWIWNEYPHVLVVLLILSSGLSMAATYHELQSKGEGRWILRVGAPGMALLSILGAFWTGLCI